MAGLRRKSKSGTSVSPSVDGSEVSRSSKKSLLGGLLKKKSKKGKNGSSKRGLPQSNDNDTSVIPENRAVQNEAAVQRAFLESNNNGGSSSNNNNSASNNESKKPYMLKIALLLVDAKTRRFELLQLEFDSDKALVSDALSQIPIHVTEKVLSSQTYTGVCGATGKEQKRSVALFDFCKGNDVLVAIPSGTSSEECARLAKPILSDEKVIGMLSTSGINADPWTTANLAAPRTPSSSSKSRSAPRGATESQKRSGFSTLIFYVIVAIVALAAITFIYRMKDSSSAPELPQLSFDPVWSTCHAACDVGNHLTDKLTFKEK